MTTMEQLIENSHRGFAVQKPACIGPESYLSRNTHWGCSHVYDETPVGLAVYVRNDPINLIDPDGRVWDQVAQWMWNMMWYLIYSQSVYRVETTAYPLDPYNPWVDAQNPIIPWWVPTDPSTPGTTPPGSGGSAGDGLGRVRERQTNTAVFVGNFQSNTRRALNRAYNQALDKLIDPSSKCAKALGKTGADAYSYLEDTAFSAGGSTYFMATTPGVPYQIDVKPNAADFAYNIAHITNPIPSNQTWTFSILHELGHLLGVLPEDATDQQQRINNDYIQENCFPTGGRNTP